MSDDKKVVPFQAKVAEQDNASPPSENAVILATLQNVMAAQQAYDGQISTLIAVISELQSHVRDLQHDVARLKKEQAKKPVILNAQGARAN